jgi:hypothetical protein
MSQFANNYYTIGLPPRSQTSFINLGISTLDFVVPLPTGAMRAIVVL